MNSSIKTVIINSNLTKKVIYKLLPNEFSQGVWNVCLKSLGYISKSVPVLKDICSISCNLVTTTRVSEETDCEILNYEQPFGVFLLESNKRKTINFDTVWLNINSLSNELQLTIKSLETKKEIIADCQVIVFMLFQRIK